MWLQLRGKALRSRDERLGHYLVGRWKIEAALCPILAWLRRWGMHIWNLKGGVSFSNLGGDFFLIEFEVVKESERVLRKRIGRFKDKTFHLER